MIANSGNYTVPVEGIIKKGRKRERGEGGGEEGKRKKKRRKRKEEREKDSTVQRMEICYAPGALSQAN
jgi:hypothetical protein